MTVSTKGWSKMTNSVYSKFKIMLYMQNNLITPKSQGEWKEIGCYRYFYLGYIK